MINIRLILIINLKDNFKILVNLYIFEFSSAICFNIIFILITMNVIKMFFLITSSLMGYIEFIESTMS